MTLPIGNFNMFNMGITPGMSFGMSGISPMSGGLFADAGLLMATSPIDTFCMTIMNDYARMEQDLIKILMTILSDPNINHVPSADILNNARPYDYNKYGKDGDKISKLAPEMQEKTMMLLDYAKSQGMNVSITSGYRTEAEQQELLRKRPKYAAKNSLHCKGRAIDIHIASGKDSDYKKLADYGKSIGMRWGGDFSKVKERWHFDISRA